MEPVPGGYDMGRSRVGSLGDPQKSQYATYWPGATLAMQVAKSMPHSVSHP